MNLKQVMQMTALVSLLGLTGSALAGKEGVSMFGGLGVGAASIQEQTPEYDMAITGNIFLGIEEDGWALEYNAIGSVEAETSVTNQKYAVAGNVISLGYRTLETKGGLYFLFSFGRGELDVDFSDATAVNHTEGNAYTLGMGMRMGKTSRLELDFSLYASKAVDATVGDTSIDDVYMGSIRYIWGGTSWDPRF